MGKDRHVVPYDDKWAVRKSGSERVSSIHRTQSAAFKTMSAKEPISYDPSRLADWVQTIKNNFMAADYETRRGMVRQFVKKIEVRPDRSAEMTWDPEAILRLADGPRIPRSVLMVMKNTCGGTQRFGHHMFGFPYPKIQLKFEILGKRRWPFGYEVLRQLQCPKYYCLPSHKHGMVAKADNGHT